MTSNTAPHRRLANRIAVITGASRGLGAAVARRLAAEGARVVLVARTQGALEQVDDAIQAAGGERAVLAPFDLTEAANIDRLGQAIFERFGKLDMLVASAAMLGVLSPLGHIDPALWDQVIQTNLTANWRLIRSLDPLLRLSDAGRAVFVTASQARDATAYWGAYAVAKAGLEAMARIYAAEVAHTNVKVNLVDPGPFRSRLRAQAFPGENPGVLPDPLSLTDMVLGLLDPLSARHGELIAQR
ncbi:MAG: SDR family NAD(P)-dependent oxidoreductase [Alphaproteobacteria bacterium]|nr:SDR family NAD(P)-dependent oxidoreductase [Alphaproteobacteria bacterium]